MNISDFKTAIQTFWADGLYDHAKSMEREAKAKKMHIGSCYTEAILDKYITQHPDMLKAKNLVRMLEPINDPVLIHGESGTGKEMLAQALHGSREGKFVAVNCPAISGDLMCSEFFGHIKGAFTGAVTDKIGKFQAAHNGTLFIDEIGDMQPNMQAALLRVLQENVITRVGANEEIEVNARIVCATNRDLTEMVANGTFRLDLYFRLNTFEITTLPLRQRPDDIPLLIKHWESLDSFRRNTKPFPTADIAKAPLRGNVRELNQLYKRWRTLGEL